MEMSADVEPVSRDDDDLQDPTTSGPDAPDDQGGQNNSSAPTTSTLDADSGPDNSNGTLDIKEEEPQHAATKGTLTTPAATTTTTIATTETTAAATQQDGADGVTTSQPSKKRKLDSLTPRRSASRAVSPPWKLATAEGPTTVIIDGKRKSTRFQPAPVQSSSAPEVSKRTTRGAAATKSTQTNGAAPSSIDTKNKKALASRSVSGPASVSRVRESQSNLRKAPSAASLKSPTKKADGRRKSGTVASSAAVNGHQAAKRGPGRPRKPSDVSNLEQLQTPASSHYKSYPSYSSYQYPSSPEDTNDGPTPRLRLRFRRPPIPNRHPQHAAPSRPYPTFADWLKSDDPLEGEEGQKVSEDKAVQEASIRLKIVEEAEHGVLRPEHCSVFATEPAEEPPTQYGHYDHVVAHALYFRKLLNKETVEHQRIAKRLAQEALEKWKEKFKKKSQEDIEEEERTHTLLRYKQIVKDVKDLWSLIRAEIDKERMAKWEAEQVRLGHKAMDSMFNQAQEILGRNLQDTSSYVSEDGSESESQDPSSAEDVSEDENMSSSGSESEGAGMEDEDAHLTREQLMAKYGQLPDLHDSSEESEDGEPAQDQDQEDQEDQEDQDQEQDQEQGQEQDQERPEPSLAYINWGDDGTPEPTPDRDLELYEAASPMDLVDNSTPADATLDVPENPYTYTNGVNGDKHTIDEDNQSIDPAAVELEEVDEALLDSEDESLGSGSEVWSDDEDDEEASEDQVGGSGSDADSEDNVGVLGFLSPDEIKKMKEAAKAQLERETQLEVKEAEEPLSEVNGMSKVNGVNGHHKGFCEDSPMTNGDDLAPAPEEATDKPIPSTEDVQAEEDVLEDADSEGRSRETSSPPRTAIPSLLRGNLRAYQHDGLDWLANLYDGQTNGILADEMGLGKTIQTIALLAWLAVDREKWGPHLVVVPTSVMLNWEMEFKKWCPGFKILTYYGDIAERQRQRRGWLNDDKYNVVITSYQLILQDAVAFKRRSWQYLILDEAHNIKNFKSLRWQTLLNFRTERRLLLTGTPLQNNIDELWSLLYFLMPAGFAGEGRIAGLEEFTMALKNPTKQILEQGRQQLDTEAQKIVRKLHEVLRPYLLRRLKADVEKQMPAKYEHVVYCRLSKRQRQLYDGFMSRADTRTTLASGNYMSIINCLMSLRKVCNHPDLFETRQIVTSFAMPKSVAADFEIKDLLIRKRLQEDADDEKVNLLSLDLLLARREKTSALHARKVQQIRATRPLEDLIARQTRRLTPQAQVDPSSVYSALSGVAEQENRALLSHFETCLRLTRARTQFLPVYGKGLIDQLTMDYEVETFGAQSLKRRKKRGWRTPLSPRLSAKWFRTQSEILLDLVPTMEARAEQFTPLIIKFSCVTPAVVANDLPLLTLSDPGVELVRKSRFALEQDPFHEPRVRLSIAFPDKRLLQYDCGKLQRLAILLRELQAGGHRALIFTQMTRVLDILEQFLNIHGHRYLRLDGATKVEQRQILTDRFNNDPRILCFILSSRSGGLGINLTGADTVIFYDLDWNPAMDKQCQDRSHRIGQTRDVHIYKFVSEYTIEANILRKSNQKRLLDDVIIQKGDFTTDYFNRVTWRDAFDEVPVDEAGAAMDRVLGDATGLTDKLQGVEDAEDAVAAKLAQKEIVDEIHVDNEDFKEANAGASSSAATLADEARARDVNGERRHVDDYLLEVCRMEFGDEPWRPPAESKRRRLKRGEDPHRVRSRKRRVV